MKKCCTITKIRFSYENNILFAKKEKLKDLCIVFFEKKMYFCSLFYNNRTIVV